MAALWRFLLPLLGLGVVYLAHVLPYYWVMEGLGTIHHSRPFEVLFNALLNAALAPTLLILFVLMLRGGGGGELNRGWRLMLFLPLSLVYVLAHHLLVSGAYLSFMLYYAYFDALPSFFLLRQASNAPYIFQQIIHQLMGPREWLTLILLAVSCIIAVCWALGLRIFPAALFSCLFSRLSSRLPSRLSFRFFPRLSSRPALVSAMLIALLVAAFGAKEIAVNRAAAPVIASVSTASRLVSPEEQKKSFRIHGFIPYGIAQWHFYRDHRNMEDAPWPGKISAVQSGEVQSGEVQSGGVTTTGQDLKNIIILQVESMDRWIIDHQIDGHEVMPNLRELKSRSLYFENFFAMHSGGYSSDAELSALTSLLPQDYLGLEAENLPLLPSLAKVLSWSGYYSIGMHPNWPTYFNRAKAYPQLGFDRVLHQLDYSGEAAGWEAKDLEFFRQSWPHIEQLPEPFLAYLVTIQSHGPFLNRSDDTLQHLDLPDGVLGDYIRAMHEVDKAIAYLMGELRHSGLLERSIVLIYGDHPSYSRRRDCIHGECVPFMIHAPGMAAGIDSGLGSHIDIAPTLLALLGIPEPPAIWLGSSLLAPPDTERGGRKVLFRNGVSVQRTPDGGWRGSGLTLQTLEADLKYIRYSDSALGGLPN